MTPEEKYILLMDAAYQAKDKVIYHQLMQKADQIIKTERTVPVITDEKAA